LQTVTYPIDVDKATAPLKANAGDDIDQARRLLSLVSHYQIFAPKLPAELGKWEKARLAAANAEQRHQAGQIPAIENETAKATLKESVGVLRTYEETMGGIVADLRKLADEFAANGTDDLSPDLKKALSDFDALKVRLAKTEVGRVLAIISPNRAWSETEIADMYAGQGDKTESARKLLKFRDQIRVQNELADTFTKTRSDLLKSKQALSTAPGDREKLTAIEEQIRSCEHDIRLRTATIRGIVDDVKKLADQFDPPAKKP
jgi:hypothetical protein